MHGKLFGNNMSVYILSHNDTFLQTNYIIFPHPTTSCFRQLNTHLPTVTLLGYVFQPFSACKGACHS
mgnify:CR=1 FL=1